MSYLAVQTELFQFYNGLLNTSLYITPPQDCKLPYTSFQSVMKYPKHTKMDSAKEIILQFSTYSLDEDKDGSELQEIMEIIEDNIKHIVSNCSSIYFAELYESRIISPLEKKEASATELHGIVQIKLYIN